MYTYVSITVLGTVAIVTNRIDLILAFMEANKTLTMSSTDVGLNRQKNKLFLEYFLMLRAVLKLS